jgi:hypothetical protein
MNLHVVGLTVLKRQRFRIPQAITCPSVPFFPDTLQCSTSFRSNLGREPHPSGILAPFIRRFDLVTSVPTTILTISFLKSAYVHERLEDPALQGLSLHPMFVPTLVIELLCNEALKF